MNIDKILEEARIAGCSDLHLTVGLPPVVRNAGSLVKMDAYQVLSENDIISISYNFV